MTSAAERAIWRLALVGLIAIVAWKLTGEATALARGFNGASTVSQPPPTTVHLPGHAEPLIPSPHIPYIGAKHAAYSSWPPTSGPHVPWTIAPGIYTSAIPSELQVHALEHGHIVIQYRRNVRDHSQLVKLARRYPADVVLAPAERLPAPIALTAWGRLELLQRVNPASITRFVVALRGRYYHGWRR